MSAISKLKQLTIAAYSVDPAHRQHDVNMEFYAAILELAEMIDDITAPEVGKISFLNGNIENESDRIDRVMDRLDALEKPIGIPSDWCQNGCGTRTMDGLPLKECPLCSGAPKGR